MFTRILFLLSLAAGPPGRAGEQPQPVSPPKVDLVSVMGCVTPGAGDTWMLTNATDPIVDQRTAQASTAGRGASRGAAPAPDESAAPPPPGKNRYRLIGILELGVPDHKGHTVTIKGLLIPGAEKKINVTSVKMVAATCRTQG